MEARAQQIVIAPTVTRCVNGSVEIT